MFIKIKIRFITSNYLPPCSVSISELLKFNFFLYSNALERVSKYEKHKKLTNKFNTHFYKNTLQPNTQT